MSIKRILRNIIIWRIFLLIFATLALIFIPFKDSFPYRETILEPYGSPLFYSWANFDGVHYLGIAKNGYFANFTQAFFPLYPALIRWTISPVNNLLASGLLISHVSFVLALYFLFKLVKKDYSKNIGIQVITFMLVFPTSFYFGAVYTESLFLLFVVSSFYFMRTKQPVKAIVLAALASATRFIGIFMLPALILEKYDQQKRSGKKMSIKAFLPYLLSSSGLIYYMYFLQKNFSDPLYFINSQPAFGAERSTDRIILLYQVIFRYTKMVLTVDPISILFYTVSQEFVISIIFSILALLAFKHVRRSYALFGFLAFITPTLTGTFSSMPRYAITLFPAFIVLALIKKPKLKKIWVIASIILLAINTMLFTRGYWVA